MPLFLRAVVQQNEERGKKPRSKPNHSCCGALCSSVLQCVAVSCSVLQCVAVKTNHLCSVAWYVYLCIYTCICRFIHTYILGYIHVYVGIHTCICSYINTYTHEYIYKHVFVYKNTYTYMYLYIHTYIYIYMYLFRIYVALFEKKYEARF